MYRSLGQAAARVICGAAMLLCSGAARGEAAHEIRVATPPVKSSAWHRLRPLGLDSRFRFIPMSQYQQAQLVVNPQGIATKDLVAYVSGGGRLIYVEQPAPRELFPIESEGRRKPRGVAGVAWCAPGLGTLSEMFWTGHAGSSPCEGRPGSGTSVLAVMNDGLPFLASHVIGRGAVLVVGQSDKIFMRDDLLLEAARFLLSVPLGARVDVDISQNSASSLQLKLKGSDPNGLAAEARVRVLPLRYDPLLDKEIAVGLPGRSWEDRRAISGNWDWTTDVPVSNWSRGPYLVAVTVHDATGRCVAAATAWADLGPADEASIRAERAVVLQGGKALFRLSIPRPADLRWSIIAPNGELSASGPVESATEKEISVSVPVGDWIPGRYLFRAVTQDAHFPREICFHVAPRRLDVPHWTGLHGIALHREKTGLLLANWRAAGLTELSWIEYPPDITALCPKGGWAERRNVFEKCFDMAAAAGVKINFWGENDKSSPPWSLLKSWGIPSEDDMVFEPPLGQKRGGGKCLTHPGIIAAMRKSYEETIGTGLLTHPAFGLFTLGDEPGRFVRCCCPRCAKRYRETMAARGFKPQDLGGETWEQAFDIATRRTKILRANKEYFTELLRDWYAAVGEPFRAVPGVQTTANHGGHGDFTLARDQYPYVFDSIFSAIEADVYPWYTCDDDSCVINWTGFTTSLLRSVSGSGKPLAVIVNLSQARGLEENRVQPLRRPPQIVLEDHYEQINVAIAEGAQRVEGYNGACFAGLPPMGKMSFLEKRPEVMGLSDERFIHEILVPTAALQKVQRQTAAILDRVSPLVKLANRPATIALFQPAVHESWGGQWIGNFKQVMGGAPVDYIGEDLEGLDHYSVVLLGENVQDDNVPPKAVEKLRAWVSQGNILISARANIGRLFQPGPAKAVGKGRTYLLDHDVKENLDGTRLLKDILVKEDRLPIAWTDYPFSTVGVKQAGESLYLFVLYYRSAVRWTPERGAFGLVDGQPVAHPLEKDIAITLNLPGPVVVYDCLDGGRLPTEAVGSHHVFRSRFRLARLKVFAVLPGPVGEMSVQCEESVTPGSPIRCRIGSNSRHLVQVRVRDPNGEEHESRMGSFFSGDEISLPTYTNDVPGRWRIRAVDPGSGLAAEASFILRGSSKASNRQ